jgi:4-amino-4-deoxy-L-arabinose transferase-like glycosyltransferase
LALADVLSIGHDQPTRAHALAMALAVALLALAVPQAPGPPVVARLPDQVTSGRRRQVGLLLLAAGLVVAAGGAVGGYLDFDTLFAGGLFAYAAGGCLVCAGLVLAGASRLRWTPRPWSGMGGRPWSLRSPAGAVGVIGLVWCVGLALRLYQLGVYPPAHGYYGAEPQAGMEALGFLAQNQHPWSAPELVYGVALSFKLFGASLLTMRYPVVLAGCSMLLAFYPCARLVFSRPVAVAGTALLAVSRLQISYYRLVLPSVTMATCELIVFFLAVRAARGRGAPATYAAMGMLLGLGLYSDASFLLAPLLLLLFALGWSVGERRHLRQLVRAHLPGWVLGLAVATIVALPYAGLVRADPQYAVGDRLASLAPLLFSRGTIADPGAVLHSNLRSLLGYWVGPGDGLAVNPPDTPMLDPLTAALFLLGLGYAVLRPGRPYLLLLLSWFAVPVVYGGVLGQTFDAARFPGYMPALYLLACVPLEMAWRRLCEWRVPAVRVGAGLFVALVVAAGWVNVTTLFAEQSHDPRVRAAFEPQDADIAAYFGGQGHGGYSYLLAPFAFPGAGTVLGWAAGAPAGRSGEDLADVLPLHDRVSARSLRVVTADPYPAMEMARAFSLVYPGTSISAWTNPDTGHVYSAAQLSTTDVAAQQGLAGPCPGAAGCADSGHPATKGIFWSGSIYIPASGIYGLSATLAPGGRLHGAVYLDGRLLTRAVLLYPGWYSLVIATPQSRRPAAAPTVWWSTEGKTGVVPSNDLRQTPAHGMLLQFLTATAPQPLVDPERVPFPVFVYPASHNGGRPLAAAPGTPYRALLTGIVASGHAGTYTLDLYSAGGRTAVFVDRRRVMAGLGGPFGAAAISRTALRLDGRAHVLQIEFTSSTAQEMLMGAALFAERQAGGRSFLPWDWLTPPSFWAAAPRWLAD